jgi:biotin carboxylase
MSTSRSIILVGRRKGAIAAAKKMGLRPVTIDVKARNEQSPRAYGGTVSWAVEEARSIENPSAVTAVTTGSVIAAAAIRAHFDLPGISVEAALRCHDKLVMKKAFTAAGIPCAPWFETTHFTTVTELVDQLKLPLLFKVPISSGGRGVVLCRTVQEVARNLHPGLLAEGFVEGIEMSVETFRLAGETLFRNHTTYHMPGWSNIVPANLDSSLAKEIDRLSDRLHAALGISEEMTHMEIFLTKSGPVVGEIAARPPGGYLMTLLNSAYQIDSWEFLLRLSLGEKPIVPGKHHFFAGVSLIHPGEGTVSFVDGLEEVTKLPDVTRVTCHLQPGDVVSKRGGSGDSKGAIFVESETRRTCAEALSRASELLKIGMKE